MNTKQIDYCIELSQTLNFSKAADNKFVSQPSFSYQIKLLEEEIGFTLFLRNGKGVTLTPAGNQFITQLRRIRQELFDAIEQGQNFSDKYQQSISIGIANREALHFLPNAIKKMEKTYPGVQIIPKFHESGNMDAFLKNEVDILFALEEETKQLANSNIFPIFNSHIYLITKNDDSLAKKQLITKNDLKGRTLMIGGGSPYTLRNLQQQLITSKKLNLSYFNSPDHDSTLTNIAAGKGICLAPGFLNDHSHLFSWIPFDSQNIFECVLCTHKDDNRPELREFIKIVTNQYTNLEDFPL